MTRIDKTFEIGYYAAKEIMMNNYVKKYMHLAGANEKTHVDRKKREKSGHVKHKGKQYE